MNGSALKRGVPGERPENRDTKHVDVDLTREVLGAASPSLWGEVARRASELAGGGHRLEALKFREPEVNHAYGTVFEHEQIVGLQVAMEDVVRVRDFERFDHGREQRQEVLRGDFDASLLPFAET